VEKKALPLTCANQSAQSRKCWTNKREIVRQARTIKAILMSHYVQGQEIGWQNQKGKRGINQQKHNQELATMTMNLRKIKE
jgi:hypothetical protein